VVANSRPATTPKVAKRLICAALGKKMPPTSKAEEKMKERKT
jgi:hypothetical protein